MMSVTDWRNMRTGGARAIIAAINRQYADTSYAGKAEPPPVVPVTVTGTNSATTDWTVTFTYSPAPVAGSRIAFGDSTDALAQAGGNTHTYAGAGPYTATLRDSLGRTTGTVSVTPVDVAVETVEFIGTEIPES